MTRLKGNMWCLMCRGLMGGGVLRSLRGAPISGLCSIRVISTQLTSCQFAQSLVSARGIGAYCHRELVFVIMLVVSCLLIDLRSWDASIGPTGVPVVKGIIVEEFFAHTPYTYVVFTST